MKAEWPLKKLGDLSDLITKGTTPTSVGHAFVSKGINFVKVESISENGRFIKSKLARITQDCHDALRRSQLKPGDILFSIAGALGRIAFVTDDIAPANTNQALAIIRLKKSDSVSPGFVLKALATGIVFEQIEKSKGGVAQQNLSLAQVREITIPMPPLPEQKRIVGILDEAFDGIATAKTNADKNLQNTRAIFESHLQSVFTQHGEGWVERRLGDIGKTQYGLSEPMNEEGKGFKIFRMGELQDGRLIDSGRMKFANIDKTEFNKYKLRPGDVLFNRTNSYELVGKTGLFNLQGDYCFASYLVRVLLNTKILLPEFLNYFMNSERFQNSVKTKASKSINQANINATILSNESVLFPVSLDHQRSIVDRFNSLRAETQSLESIYQRKIDALDKLKKSLLHQAFIGEL